MLLTLKQVREKYNLSRATLLNWEKEDLLHPAKTPKGTRRYIQSDLEHLIGIATPLSEELVEGVILYARVSTKKTRAVSKKSRGAPESLCGVFAPALHRHF